jgi:hypothetical protein
MSQVTLDYSAWSIVETKPLEWRPTGMKRADGSEVFASIGFPCVRFILHHRSQRAGKNTVITASNKSGPTVKVVNSLGHEKRYEIRGFFREAQAKYGPDVARQLLLSMLENGIIR